MTPSAAQLLRCPLTGRMVLLAPGRADRPNLLREASSDCPFCRGHETHTLPALVALNAVGEPTDGPDWQVRAVPNLYSAAPPGGAHEVLIECPDHRAPPDDLNAPELAVLWQLVRARLNANFATPTTHAVTYFRNVGARAGASIPHLHSQLLATPFVPPDLIHELKLAAEYQHNHGICGYCELAQTPLDTEPGFAVVLPPAPRFAYELWILPTTHQSDFQTITNIETHHFSQLLTRTVARLRRAIPDLAYNCYLHTTPREYHASFHWHLELIPRTAQAAGFEWATNCFINTTAPEMTAQLFAPSQSVS